MVIDPIKILPINTERRYPTLLAIVTPNGFPMLIARKVKGNTAPTSSFEKT